MLCYWSEYDYSNALFHLQLWVKRSSDVKCQKESVCVLSSPFFSSASVHYHSSYPCMQLNYWNPFSHKCEDRFTMNTQLLLLSLKTIICIDFAVIWLVNLKIKNVVLESWVTLLKWELFVWGFLQACCMLQHVRV